MSSTRIIQGQEGERGRKCKGGKQRGKQEKGSDRRITLRG